MNQMTQHSPRNSYLDRVSRVIDHIHDHPGDDLSLEVLAGVAAMSPYHWHRIFHAMTGETCARAVRRVRMHRAAMLLIETSCPPGRIGAAVGYPVLRSFTRAFGDHFGMTPAEFRTRGAVPFPETLPEHPKGDPTMFNVEITDQPERRLAALRHTGPYNEINRAFTRLGTVIAEAQLGPSIRGMAAVYHDDPMVTPAPELRSDAGFIVDQDTPLPDTLSEVHLPGGKHALLVYRGPYTGFQAAYTYLYGTWLPASGETPADSPSYEVYLNSPMDTAPDDLLTHILLPLR